MAKLPKRPALILDMPCAISSWLLSQRVPACWCSTWALEAVSKALTSDITSTGITRRPNSSQPSRPGQTKCGSPDGRWPTTAPPLSAKPPTQLTMPVMAMTKMADGNAGRHFLASTRPAMLSTPNRIERQSNSPSDGLSHTVAQSLFMPSRLGSCDARIKMAAAWVKPASTGEVTRLSSHPARTSPSDSCTMPDRIAIHAASTTHWAEPGSAMPVSEAPINRADSAVGPTPRRGDGLKRMATAAGMMEA
ncbi:hypothetical protein D3C72_1012690 [compost metagenome]